MRKKPGKTSLKHPLKASREGLTLERTRELVRAEMSDARNQLLRVNHYLILSQSHETSITLRAHDLCLDLAWQLQCSLGLARELYEEVSTIAPEVTKDRKNLGDEPI
jgi:hypothetical protein